MSNFACFLVWKHQLSYNFSWMVPRVILDFKRRKKVVQEHKKGMRLGSINGLRCKQLKLVILAFFMMFLLWKLERGTYYTTEILRPDSLILAHPGHFTHTEIFWLHPFHVTPIFILILFQIFVANSKFVDQHTSSEEDFPNADTLTQSVVKVEQQVSDAPPPMSIASDSADVADEREPPPSGKKGIVHLL